MLENTLNIILGCIILFLLFIASIQDFKSREIVDWVWITMSLSGMSILIVIALIQILEGTDIQDFLLNWIWNLSFAIMIFLVLTFSGFGGEADRIAFFVLGLVSHNIEPILEFNNAKYELISPFIPNIISIFFNAYLLAIPVPIIIFSFNLVGKLKNKEKYTLPEEGIISRILVLFSGYPHSTTDILESIETKPWHFDFLEILDENGNWKINFKIRLDSPEEDYSRKIEIATIIKSNPDKKYVWVQPSIPFSVLIFLGFILNLLFGNLIFIIFSILV
ncbi:MAG: A24 family peptidase C-terminal domain-containing protein [Candidatus Hodarchaeales archaeon]